MARLLKPLLHKRENLSWDSPESLAKARHSEWLAHGWNFSSGGLETCGCLTPNGWPASLHWCVSGSKRDCLKINKMCVCVCKWSMIEERHPASLCRLPCAHSIQVHTRPQMYVHTPALSRTYTVHTERRDKVGKHNPTKQKKNICSSYDVRCIWHDSKSYLDNELLQLTTER